MLNKKTLFCLLASSAILSFASAQQCKQCMPNGAYCIDSTSFYICPDGENHSTSSGPIKCTDNKLCTSADDICAAAPATSVCSGSSGVCGVCGTDRMICETRTEYSFCMNGQKTTSSCPEGQVCSKDLYDSAIKPKKICAPEATLEFLSFAVTCDGTTTPAPAPTDPVVLSEACKAAEANGENSANARYFYTRNPTDATCRTYIYCEKNNDRMEGILFTCPNNGIWNSATKKCGATGSCNATPATSTTTTVRPPVAKF